MPSVEPVDEDSGLKLMAMFDDLFETSDHQVVQEADVLGTLPCLIVS